MNDEDLIPFIKKAFVLGIVIVIIMFILSLIGGIIITVPAGSVGVQNTFGVVDTNLLQPGLHIKNPFTEVINYNTRTMKYMDYGKSDVATITALSNDGLETTMGIAVNYRINPEKAAELFKRVGTDYSGVIMVNPIHSVPRDMISKYDTKTLYSASQEGSSDRTKLERELYASVADRINEMGVKDSIIIEQVSIRNIDFVQTYKDSIASKMKMDTEIQQKKLEVDKQVMEAKRVSAEAEGTANKARIEAQGKADAARIEAQGMADASAKLSLVSDNYINLYYLQTMKDNPKAIYIPVGQNGLPLFRSV
jgi:regulator of protease activity HflC (stomatin/prohibitin superfamily)